MGLSASSGSRACRLAVRVGHAAHGSGTLIDDSKRAAAAVQWCTASTCSVARSVVPAPHHHMRPSRSALDTGRAPLKSGQSDLTFACCAPLGLTSRRRGCCRHPNRLAQRLPSHDLVPARCSATCSGQAARLAAVRTRSHETTAPARPTRWRAGSRLGGHPVLLRARYPAVHCRYAPVCIS